MMRKISYYLTHWEVWHWFAKYIIIGPAWLWYCLKSRSLWFFTPSNPTITFGGFVGESKSEIYKQLPDHTYPSSIFVSQNQPINEILDVVNSKQLRLPLAVKPDVGMMGFMFRKVDTMDQLRQYHEFMSVPYIIQEYVDYPLEVSVFYYRYPHETRGHITGFIKKEFMQVIGDGARDLETLIRDYPRATFRRKELLSKHETRLKNIIPKDQTYCLSHALNLSRGGRLVSLETEKDDKLLKVFDNLSKYGDNKFFYGRYDIKCSSISDLKDGINFSILEFNGCGAEPHHVYGNGFTFIQACKILIDHWDVLYNISRVNRASGIKPWSFLKGLEFSKKSREHFKQLKSMDTAFEFNKQNSVVKESKSEYVSPALITQQG